MSAYVYFILTILNVFCSLMLIFGVKTSPKAAEVAVCGSQCVDGERYTT